MCVCVCVLGACRLQAQQKDWLASQAELLAQGSVLKAELSAAQLDRTRLEGELSALRETNQSLDLSSARLTSQYQVMRSKLSEMKPCHAETRRCFITNTKPGKMRLMSPNGNTQDTLTNWIQTELSEALFDDLEEFKKLQF